MSEWKTYKLEEIASVQTGPFGSQLHQSDYVEVGTPIITVEHLGENRIVHNNLPRVSDIDKQRLNKYWLQEDDIVFSRVGSVDRRAYVKKDEDGWLFSGRCLRVRPKEKVNGKYLSYFFGLEDFKRKIRGVAVGATMPSLNTSIMNDIEILLPDDINLQSEIASILSSLDDKIELNLQMNQTLETMAQAIFKEWFVNFNFPGFDGVLVDGLPKEWRMEKLGDMVDVKGGTTPSTTVEEYWNGEYYWSTPKDLSNIHSSVLLDTERKITEAGIRQIGSGVLPKGTLLLSSRAPIGYLAISQVPISINQGYIAIQGKLVSNLFMLFWLKQNMDAVKGRANGSTFQEISKSSFKEIETSVPEKGVLKLFDEIVNPIFDRIIANEIETRTITQIRDGLLPKLMTGKIEVKA